MMTNIPQSWSLRKIQKEEDKKALISFCTFIGRNILTVGSFLGHDTAATIVDESLHLSEIQEKTSCLTTNDTEKVREAILYFGNMSMIESLDLRGMSIIAIIEHNVLPTLVMMIVKVVVEGIGKDLLVDLLSAFSNIVSMDSISIDLKLMKDFMFVLLRGILTIIDDTSDVISNINMLVYCIVDMVHRSNDHRSLALMYGVVDFMIAIIDVYNSEDIYGAIIELIYTLDIEHRTQPGFGRECVSIVVKLIVRSNDDATTKLLLETISDLLLTDLINEVLDEITSISNIQLIHHLLHSKDSQVVTQTIRVLGFIALGRKHHKISLLNEQYDVIGKLIDIANEGPDDKTRFVLVALSNLLTDLPEVNGDSVLLRVAIPRLLIKGLANPLQRIKRAAINLLAVGVCVGSKTYKKATYILSEIVMRVCSLLTHTIDKDNEALINDVVSIIDDILNMYQASLITNLNECAVMMSGMGMVLILNEIAKLQTPLGTKVSVMLSYYANHGLV